VVSPIALIGTVIIIFIAALPAIRYNGLGFFLHSAWKPGNSYGNTVVTNGIAHAPGAQFGGIFLVVGTVLAAFIAILLGVPISIGAAVFIFKKMPAQIAGFANFLLEILAGIPSVIFGLWGALALGPVIARDISPIIANHIPKLGPLKFFTGNVGSGEGLLTSGIVLAIMIVPIVASTTAGLLKQVPDTLREGARALGMTEYEILKTVDLRWIKSGIIGSAVLGLGRALGETMAVAMVSGAFLGALPTSIYSTMTTIAATIATQLDSALQDSTGFTVSVLAEAGLVLLLINLIVNVFARIMIGRSNKLQLPNG
jgi:phosphate transport system permease protein